MRVGGLERDERWMVRAICGEEDVLPFALVYSYGRFRRSTDKSCKVAGCMALSGDEDERAIAKDVVAVFEGGETGRGAVPAEFFGV